MQLANQLELTGKYLSHSLEVKVSKKTNNEYEKTTASFFLNDIGRVTFTMDSIDMKPDIFESMETLTEGSLVTLHCQVRVGLYESPRLVLVDYEMA